MNNLEDKISNSKVLLYWFLGWTSLGVLQSFRLYFAYNVFNPDLLTWQKAAIWGIGEWYLWGVLSIFIIKIITWLNNKSMVLKILTFIVGLICLPAIHLYLYSVFWYITREIFPAPIGTSYETYHEFFIGSYLGKVNDNSVAYFLIVAAIYAYTYYKRLFLEQQRVAEVNKQLVEAKLEHLKTQLQPHFLFNTLNTITALIHTDPDRADLMTTKLSDLLRISLDSESTQEVSLSKEMSFVENYLDIQKVRFDDRMDISITIDDQTKKALVPYLILQPIVENTIKHSVAISSEKVSIEILSEIKDSCLILSITNSGKNLPDDIESSIADRTGLQNTRERLQQLYQENASLTLQNNQPNGVIVTLKIPLTYSECR